MHVVVVEEEGEEEDKITKAKKEKKKKRKRKRRKKKPKNSKKKQQNEGRTNPHLPARHEGFRLPLVAEVAPVCRAGGVGLAVVPRVSRFIVYMGLWSCIAVSVNWLSFLWVPLQSEPF